MTGAGAAVARPGSRAPAVLAGILCLALASLSAGPAAARQTALPFRLLVNDYQASLGSMLLSGEFENVLERPLLAWRGELELRADPARAPIVLFVEHRARRPILPGQWGVWSAWVRFDPEVPEHVALRGAGAGGLSATLRLIRVLFADGSERAF